MDLEAPPPRDPTLLRLGRRLRREDMQFNCCDEATVNLLLEEGSRELAWAVKVRDYEPPEYRVGHFWEMINNNLVVFRMKGNNVNVFYELRLAGQLAVDRVQGGRRTWVAQAVHARRMLPVDPKGGRALPWQSRELDSGAELAYTESVFRFTGAERSYVCAGQAVRKVEEYIAG